MPYRFNPLPPKFDRVDTTSVPPEVATEYVCDSGSAVPAANVLNVLGSDGCTTLGSGSTVTVRVDGLGADWEEESVPFNAEVGKGYFCNAALTATLPAGPVLGDTIIFYVDTTGLVTIQANAGQMIQFGTNITPAAGTLSTTGIQGYNVELVYKPSDITWHTIASIGNWEASE